ncbi:hypothetical protein [Sediminibacillus albus]|uniref:hypothetical protein n=1 Tax=Sediminibacillus albus TaxID=407036 RepID=UPI0011141420|nr:hypothetical protein [Sediminibacillus albus]
MSLLEFALCGVSPRPSFPQESPWISSAKSLRTVFNQQPYQPTTVSAQEYVDSSENSTGLKTPEEAVSASEDKERCGRDSSHAENGSFIFNEAKALATKSEVSACVSLSTEPFLGKNTVVTVSAGYIILNIRIEESNVFEC